MLDISANALAVLILATMLVLSVAAPPAPQGEVRSSERPDLFYPSPLDVAVAPQSAYWIATEAGLTPLDLDSMAAALADGATVGRTDQGEATLIIDRRNYRDLNDHRLQIAIDWDAARAVAQSLDSSEDTALAGDAIRTAHSEYGIAPTFVVTAEGMASFAQLYWYLRNERVPMRWVTIADGSKLILFRRVDAFETRGRQWLQ
jgi:hypothetical protein